MSKRERVRISLNLDNPRHVQALELLQAYDSKQRSDYIVECILTAADAQHLERLIGRMPDERLRLVQFSTPATLTAAPTAHEDGLPASMPGLLDEFWPIWGHFSSPRLEKCPQMGY